jgi:hypothetical protein
VPSVILSNVILVNVTAQNGRQFEPEAGTIQIYDPFENSSTKAFSHKNTLKKITNFVSFSKHSVK